MVNGIEWNVTELYGAEDEREWSKCSNSLFGYQRMEMGEVFTPLFGNTMVRI